MVMASDRVHAELKRPVEILAFVLLLAGAGAWCQNGVPSPGLPQNLCPTAFRPVQEERQELRSAQSLLPDAPSAVPAKRRERYQTSREAIFPLIFAGAAITPTLASESPEYLAPKIATRVSVLREAPVVQKEPNVVPAEHLYPSLWQDLRYPTSDSFMGRVNYAASRLFIPRDNSGKRRFNTSYLLAALASAAVANTTYRRYRTQLVPHQTQSASATFGNFGSAVGGDAGRNVLQQFWPRIHQTLQGHSLKALQTVEERSARDSIPAALASTLAR